MAENPAKRPLGLDDPLPHRLRPGEKPGRGERWGVLLALATALLSGVSMTIRIR